MSSLYVVGSPNPHGASKFRKILKMPTKKTEKHSLKPIIKPI